MRKRKVFIACLASLLIILVLIGICQFVLQKYAIFDQVRKAQTRSEQIIIDTAYAAVSGENASGLKDGTYEGTAKGYGGPLTVSVTVKKGRIETIDIISHAGEDAAYYNMAAATAEDILSAQTPDVDTVSDATFTSNAIKNAVITALQQAVA